jgi:HD-GYP domain-containing protein (c-di-GMP phosphodiesterase class II)/pSer/pThr/pTyr-binding forkhead associated (FHA) protein
MHYPVEGQRWETDKPVRIGRQDGLEIVLAHPSVSRQHAEVSPTPNGWVVRDLKSSHGTFVNGVRVGQANWKLNLHDVVQCGSVALKVAGMEEEATPAPAPVPKERPMNIKTSGEFTVKVQATAKRSWEKALESLAGDSDHQLQQGKHFLTLLRAGYHFCNVDSMDQMLQSILEDTVAVLRAQRGSVVLMDERLGRLHPRAVSANKHQLKSGKVFSKTLAERCFGQGESLLCRDVNTDPELQQAYSVQQGTMASIICALFRSPRKRLGVLHLDRGPLQPPFTEEDFFLADAIAASVSVGIETALMVESQRDGFLQSMTAVARIAEKRVPHLAGHGERVASYATLLGEALQVTDAEYQQLKAGAALHDLGYIEVDAQILNKPGPLTPGEWEQVRAHTTHGAALVETTPTLAPIVPIIRNHHERFDGQGYPDRLTGENIPRLARIVAVADAFDAMISARPYRPARSVDEALRELKDKSGSQFCPECVQALGLLQSRLKSAVPQAEEVAAG